MPGNEIIGVLRFSYPAKEGFAVSGMEEAALEAHLYDDARLKARFRLLETVALPSLAAQTDPDFALVILAGTTLPIRHRQRLRSLESAYPFLQVCFMERTGALAAAKRSFRRGIRGAPSHVTGFRIDDDDAVATDYVARTRDMADRLLGADLANRPTVVAFARGVYWDMHAPAQPFWDFREAQPLGLACAMITDADLPTCVYRYNHRRLPCHVPTLMEPDGHAFLRTLHGHNDSGRSIPPHATRLPTRRARRMLAERFGLDADRAIALMPEPPAAD
ncbi:putative rhamnosyl transferase [Jannaschia sp. W003]|uniref:putative rhamnosyl transferase n=1 Tax=Jannaschia sp. W003 TaxID=2867012 RepID=UPI0021A44A82|nr:putative rhamnosyl transferase [Jannaschia sp. W003]UWQ20882.1 putative rhamnosyl transferase [Jannaschia sp. W003]